MAAPIGSFRRKLSFLRKGSFRYTFTRRTSLYLMETRQAKRFLNAACRSKKTLQEAIRLLDVELVAVQLQCKIIKSLDKLNTLEYDFYIEVANICTDDQKLKNLQTKYYSTGVGLLDCGNLSELPFKMAAFLKMLRSEPAVRDALFPR